MQKIIGGNKLDFIARIIVSGILLQTLFFKFSGAEESIHLFTKLGIEPWGRYGSGVYELLCSILLWLPKWVWVGAWMSLGAMSGAIFAHLVFIGIEVGGDGGGLFIMAVVVFLLSVFLALTRLKEARTFLGF